MSKKKSEKKPESKRGKWFVVLMNDNRNTFDDVTDALMDVCGYAYLSAVQCAVITHEAGRCKVWEGKHEECSYIQKQLIREGLNVMLEKYVKTID
jgi:ATP-dependent Clp protease adaptor protein ClpS